MSPNTSTPPDIASPQVDHNETPRVLFNDPDADLVLRSGDSHTCRVLKLYIIRSSTVLGKMIQAASDTFGTANSTSAETRLPEVQLSESGTILSCLLTFIFPESSHVIPSPLEEKMELLSVAQKYKMNSVIDHIRGSLSMQDPPFIHRENAFLAYSLAQRYELRREAIQAARLTLKFTLTIEKFGDVISGAYLFQLWNYRQRVQAWLKHDLPLSGAGDMLKAFKCSETATTGPPYWVNLYISSIAENPSSFDPIEFQMALVRHATGGLPAVSGFGSKTVTAGCSFCTNIPAENMRTFWMNLTAIVHRSMEKVSIVLYVYYTSMYSDALAGRRWTNISRDRNEFSDLRRLNRSFLSSSRMLGHKWGRRHITVLRSCQIPCAQSDSGIFLVSSGTCFLFLSLRILGQLMGFLWWIFRRTRSSWDPSLRSCTLSHPKSRLHGTESWLCSLPRKNTTWVPSKPLSAAKSHAENYPH